MGDRGPLPSLNARRRNKRVVTGKHIEIARPKMPSTLTVEAKREWRRIVPELDKMGVLTTLDRGLLIRYCTAYADWMDVDAKLQQSSKLIKGRRDGLVRNPLWLLRRELERSLTELSRQLGLTPTARLRAGIVHERPKPDAAERPAAIDDYRRRLAQ